MRELWTAPEPRFQGKHVAFSDLVFSPPTYPARRASDRHWR